MDPELSKKVDQACTTSEEFTRLYYKNIDKSRHQISRLYMDTAVLVWNGNGTTGGDRIQKFLIDLPPSEHKLLTLDAQPIVEESASHQLTFLIQACGNVKYQDSDSSVRSFQQTFIIMAVGDKWKIVSDCFRLQSAPNSGS